VVQSALYATEFHGGQTVVVSGVVRKNVYDMPPIEMDSPEYEIVSDVRILLSILNGLSPSTG